MRSFSREKKELWYQEAQQSLRAVLYSGEDIIARMSTISCVLKQTLPYYFWVGFYRVNPQKPEELIVGPYQGTLGCLQIPFTKGVCGACATRLQTILVPDVHAFPGHIACDSRSQSEIVVPVFDSKNNLLAVFDVDSESSGAFDTTDQEWLERILAEHFMTLQER